MFDLTQLRTFIAVVRERHLTRASERLHISQPAASRHIRTLEEHFGLSLFSRTARGLEVTPAGQRLAELAAKVIQDTQELSDVASELVGAPAARMLIGTIADPGLLSALPMAVQAVRAEFPLVELNFEAGNSRFIRQAIKAGELDAGFIVESVKHDPMTCHAFRSLEYVLVGPSDWQQRLEACTLPELVDMPWVITRGGTDIIERRFEREGLKLNVVTEVSNHSLLLAMVEGKLGIGFLGKNQAEAGVAGGRLCIVEGFEESLPLNFVYAQQRASDPVLGRFADALKAAWGGLR